MTDGGGAEPASKHRGDADPRAEMGWARRRARIPGSATLIDQVCAPKFALTFDDGPDPAGTPAVLEALAESRAPATFFVLTERADADRGLTRELVARGHQLGLHGDRHERVDLLSIAAVSERLASARARLEDLAGIEVSHFRPPWGRASWRTFLGARRAGLAIALWSHDPRDWEPEIERRLARCLVAGAVVLLHDGSSEPATATAAALRESLPPALAEGLVAGTLPGAARTGG